MKKLVLVFSLVLAMAIPAIAADSTSLFNENVLGTNIEQSASVTPVGTVITWASDKMPNDGPGVWLECDGRAIPGDAKYQDLRDYLMSSNTPNYTNQFLRGGTSAQVGQVAADSTRSHAHQIDQHSHTVSGTASSQTYQAPAVGGGGYAAGVGGLYTYECTYYSDPSSGPTFTVDSNVPPDRRGYPVTYPENDKFCSGSDSHVPKLIRTNVIASGGGKRCCANLWRHHHRHH